MMRKESQTEVLEERLLRYTWWLFPVLGGLWAVTGSRWLWMWVSISGEIPAVYEWCWLRVMMLMFAGACIPGVWYFGILIGRRWGDTIKKYALVPMGVVLFVGLLDAAISTTAVQAPFWIAVRTRAREGDFMLRELTYVKLEDMSSGSPAKKRLVTVGSSQLLHAVDEDLLQKECPERTIVRRAMAGTSPLKALGAYAYTRPLSNDLVVMYLSEFDFIHSQAMPTDWLRPLVSFKGVCLMLSCYSSPERVTYWRQFVDLIMASMCEFWRDRDYAGYSLFHMWNAQEMTQNRLADKPEMDRIDEIARDAQTIENEAFLKYAGECRDVGAQLVVFAGQLNPAMYSGRRLLLNKEVTRWLEKNASLLAPKFHQQEGKGVVNFF